MSLALERRRQRRQAGRPRYGFGRVLAAIALLMQITIPILHSSTPLGLANKAGDQLSALSKANAKKGNAMWDLALDIGRQTLEALAEETKAGKRGKSR